MTEPPKRNRHPLVRLVMWLAGIGLLLPGLGIVGVGIYAVSEDGMRALGHPGLLALWGIGVVAVVAGEILLARVARR